MPINKREFVSYWSQDVVKQVDVKTDFKSTQINSRFFRNSKDGSFEYQEMIYPCDIPHDMLTLFQNKKTRITIEIID